MKININDQRRCIIVSSSNNNPLIVVLFADRKLKNIEIHNQRENVKEIENKKFIRNLLN